MLPLLQRADVVPQDKLPELPTKPSILEWADKVARWGLLCAGTYLEQPADFMRDVEVAGEERSFYRSQQRKKKVSSDFDGAPKLRPL